MKNIYYCCEFFCVIILIRYLLNLFSEMWQSLNFPKGRPVYNARFHGNVREIVDSVGTYRGKSRRREINFKRDNFGQ